MYCGTVVMIVDIVEWFEKSDQLLPITSAILYAIGFGLLNLPACYFGSFQGFIQPTLKPPCRVSVVKKPRPDQPWYLRTLPSSLIGSFVIFTVIGYEFHYIVTSVWRSQLFGFLIFIGLALMLLIAVTSLISILNTFLALRNGNHRWWWRSFWMGQGVSFWAFAYCGYMALVEFKLPISDIASNIIYYVEAQFICSIIGFMTGAVSVCASWVFLHVLYA